MRISLTTLLLVLLGHTVLSQSNTVDSLRAALRRLPPIGTSAVADTNRLQTLYALVSVGTTPPQDAAHLDLTDVLIRRYRWRRAEPWQQLYRGLLRFRQNEVYLAIDQYIDALNRGEKIALGTAFFARCHRQLGSAYFSLEEYRLALLHYKKTISLYQSGQQSVANRELAILKNNVGLCYMNLAHYAQADAYFGEVIREAQARHDSLALAWGYSNLGTSERRTKQYQRSIEHLTEAIRCFGPTASDNKALTISELALAYLALGQIRQANRLVDSAKQMTVNGRPFFTTFIADAAYRTAKAAKQPQRALTELERYDSLRLINDKLLKQKSIDGLRSSYQAQKRAVEIERQRTQNIALLAGVGMSAVFLLYFIYNQWLLRRKNRKIERQNQLIETANASLTRFNEELERRVEERTQQLQQAYDEIKTAMVQGQTRERKRMASELHDNLGSMLSGIRFQMQAIEPDALHPAERNVYGRVLEMLGEAYHEVRHISHNLLPAVLETHGLYAALSKLVADLNVNKRIQFTLLADEPPQFDQPTAVELYCILLELITNLLKHSTASRVVIAFTEYDDHTGIELHDNGQLYDFQSHANGKGVSSVLSRAEAIGATISHRPNEQGGNCIETCVPLQRVGAKTPQERR